MKSSDGMDMDNRQTEEAARVRQKSEFLKQVEDFARYMQMEHIDGCEGRSLLISAGDRFDGESRGGMAHVILGDQAMVTATLASMMRQEGFGDIVRAASRVSAETDDDMEDVIRSSRRRLKTDCWLAALAAVWTLLVIAFAVWGTASWITTVSSLLLMAWVGTQLWQEIRRQRRFIARVEARARQERQERMRHCLETMTSFFEDLRERLSDDGEDDDEDGF